MEEIWKDIEDYEGLYQVSNLGNVRRILFINNKVIKPKINILKQNLDKYGRYRVHLNKNGQRKNKQVHRLVAQAFIPNTNDYPEVNHKDENPKNNRVDNLEWCTHNYNMHYGNIELKKLKNKKMKKVKQYSSNGIYIKTWNKVSDITKNLNISKQLISMCCKGKIKTAKNYRWEYVNE